MRNMAMTMAVGGLIALAVLCTLSGLPPDVTAVRAGIGAVAIYVLVRVAGRVTAGVMADAIVKRIRQLQEEDEAGE